MEFILESWALLVCVKNAKNQVPVIRVGMESNHTQGVSLLLEWDWSTLPVSFTSRGVACPRFVDKTEQPIHSREHTRPLANATNTTIAFTS